MVGGGEGDGGGFCGAVGGDGIVGSGPGVGVCGVLVLLEVEGFVEGWPGKGEVGVVAKDGEGGLFEVSAGDVGRHFPAGCGESAPRIQFAA